MNIQFKGDPIELPKGYTWSVFRYFTPAGTQVSPVKFNKFDKAIHHWQDGDFHLFELWRGSMRVMAYCLIKYTKK